MRPGCDPYVKNEDVHLEDAVLLFMDKVPVLGIKREDTNEEDNHGQNNILPDQPQTPEPIGPTSYEADGVFSIRLTKN